MSLPCRARLSKKNELPILIDRAVAPYLHLDISGLRKNRRCPLDLGKPVFFDDFLYFFVGIDGLSVLKIIIYLVAECREGVTVYTDKPAQLYPTRIALVACQMIIKMLYCI